MTTLIYTLPQKQQHKRDTPSLPGYTSRQGPAAVGRVLQEVSWWTIHLPSLAAIPPTTPGK